MRDHLPVDNDELHAWMLSEVIVRTAFDVPAPRAEASKLWLAVWLAASLAVTIVLAITAAPAFAYGVPLAGLLLSARGKAHLEVDTRRSRGIQRRTSNN